MSRRHTLSGPWRPTSTISALVALATVAPSAWAAPAAVAFKRVDMDAFQSFVVNWDEKASPFLCALIGSEKQWAKVMHPAAVMGQAKPFGPEAAMFKDSDILVIARVVPGGGDFRHAVEIKDIHREGRGLQVTAEVATRAPASTTVKAFSVVAIPKDKLGSVVVAVGGKTVCRVAPGPNWVQPQSVASK